MKLRLFLASLAILWIGMILAIGMESVVKFSTPTLIKAVGFDVGRTVFSAFNKVQALIVAIMILSSFFVSLKKLEKLILACITMILLLQIFWLFPILSQHVDIVLAGSKPPTSYAHPLYGILEIVKLILLLIFAIKLYAKQVTQPS